MTEKLIQAIQKREVLYNTQVPQYRDLAARTAAWKEIAQELNMPVEECRDNWSRLRNSFTNALKRRLKSKQKNKELPPWRHQADLTFLKPFIEFNDEKDMAILNFFEEKAKKLNSSENLNVSDSELLECKSEVVFFDEESNVIDEVSTVELQQISTNASFEAPITRKRKRSHDGVNEKILEKLQKISQQIEPTANDEFDDFSKYIASSLRTLSTENSIKAKLELQTALARIQLQQCSKNQEVIKCESFN